jgi:hypothetical protein
MRRQIIRAALLMYPSAWRRRYGGELEQLFLDCTADGASVLGSTRLLIDVTWSGLAQRIRNCGTRTRIVAVSCLCAAAGIAIDAASVTTADTLDVGNVHVGLIWLAPNSLLKTHVMFVHAPVWELPRSFQPVPRRITVQFLPGTSHVIGIIGPPSSTVLNPNSGRIVSVRAGG